MNLFKDLIKYEELFQFWFKDEVKHESFVVFEFYSYRNNQSSLYHRDDLKAKNFLFFCHTQYPSK